MNSSNRKILLGVVLTAAAVVSEATAMPCQHYDLGELAALAEEYTAKFVKSCSDMATQHKQSTRRLQPAHLAWKQDSENSEEFWDDWLGLNDVPVLSSQSDTTYYGVSVWMPEKYEDLEISNMEDAEEWIKKHGVHMSLGMRGSDRSSPRVRLDYRWHNDNLDDFFLQVEFPLD